MHKLEPVFDFATDESNFLIHKSQAEVCINQTVYKGDGEVYLELLPRASIYFYGYFQDVPTEDAFSVINTEIPSFSINNHKFEGFCVSSGGSGNSQEFNIKWSPNVEPTTGVGDESTQISLLVFHLFNFVDLIGTRRSKKEIGSKIHFIEHVDMIYDEWSVELKSLVSTRQNIKLLKEEGGYKLTHIGVVKKTDGALFSGEDAVDILNAIRFFLSFAKGEWCYPVCAVGFDASGDRVWESWSSPREPWRSHLSWFDSHNTNQLVTLFPKFMRMWEDDDWHDAMREIIYWYVNAKSSSMGIDGGIILTQAALERLSYEYVVKDNKLLSKDGYKKLKASDKFLLLFSSLGIPIEILNETPDIAKLAKEFNWLDNPQALTEIRNSLVHPEHKKHGKLGSIYYEAWNLGLWYLELGLLAICGYAGTYSNRLKQRWVGEVEYVPWLKEI